MVEQEMMVVNSLVLYQRVMNPKHPFTHNKQSSTQLPFHLNKSRWWLSVSQYRCASPLHVATANVHLSYHDSSSCLISNMLHAL